MKDINFIYLKKLYIDNSNISNMVLFAGENINKGETILKFEGTLALQSDRYSGKYMGSTFVGLSESIMLCETNESEKDFSDYINHSCNPNAGMFDCLTIIAIRDINIGDEIVCDYALGEADEKWCLETKCNCRSSNCRGQVSRKDWLNISPGDEYYEYYSPFLKRRILEYAKRS
ncbi:MAG: SET domain-containing protein [Clostridiales bacterium]|nr:SET domain-containing protein [Clostridiales bacterium]